MTSGNSVEAITSDPVIVEVPKEENPAKPEVTTKEPEKTELEDEVERLEIREESRRSYRQPERVRVIERDFSRSRSPPYRRRPLTDCTVLSSTKTLNDILDESDSCIETIKGHLVYITNHAFHTADLQKLSWLFQLGIADSWAQKPMPFIYGNEFQYELPHGRSGARGGADYYDDGCGYNVRYDRNGPVPLARLGAALRLIKDDADPMAAKVKFVIAVQTKSDSRWVKLIINHSRQAAAVSLFHEILNSHSIIFVGAVLRDVAIPAENPNMKARKLQRVGSVKEAEEVDQGVIGVIC